MSSFRKTFFDTFLVIFIFVAFSSISRSSSTLQVTVYTGKGSYTIEETIIIYGYVKFENAPVNNASVAVEIRDPIGTPIAVRTLSTNSSGTYYATFTLFPEAPAGTYTVNATCSIGSDKATNTTSFVLEKILPIVVTVYMGRSTYRAGETVTVFGEVKQGSTPIAGVLVAVEVEDVQKTPLVVRVLETNNDGVYSLAFQLPSSSPIGVYSVHVTATFEGYNAASNTTFSVTQEFSADINGDGKVNIIDLTLIALAWGSSPGHPRWDERCDLDRNEIVNIIDITLAAREFTH